MMFRLSQTHVKTPKWVIKGMHELYNTYVVLIHHLEVIGGHWGSLGTHTWPELNIDPDHQKWWFWSGQWYGTLVTTWWCLDTYMDGKLSRWVTQHLFSTYTSFGGSLGVIGDPFLTSTQNWLRSPKMVILVKSMVWYLSYLVMSRHTDG